jgi:transposase InsO family protein
MSDSDKILEHHSCSEIMTNRDIPTSHVKSKNRDFSPFPKSVIYEETDGRPFAVVQVLGLEIAGLLDTGAAATFMGRGCEEILRKLNINIDEKVQINVTSAAGIPHEVKGTVNIPFFYNNLTHFIPVIIVPSFKNKLILGVDFIKKFRIVIQLHCSAIMSTPEDVQTEVELDSNQRNELFQTIKTLRVANDEMCLPVTNVLKGYIDTGDAHPIIQRSHVYSPYVQERINEEIVRMLKWDVIEPSSSPWSSPLVAVPKKDGRMRVCLDSRKLNSVTKRDAYPLPNLNRILGQLQHTKFLSSIDLSSAFWQLELSPESRPCTAFTVPTMGLFQFKRVAMGLVNAAGMLSRAMNIVLGNSLEPYVFHYMDDILICTETLQKHLEILKIVAQKLSDANLAINLEKSKFLQTSLTFLGYVLDETGLRPDPGKVSAVVNYPAPRTITELRRFLGAAGWYRRFIGRFSEVAAPLTKLLQGSAEEQKRRKFVWTKEAEESFNNLKKVMISAPVLCNPDFSKPFSIHTDASDVGLSGILIQDSDEGDERIIAYFSHKLTSTQRKYSACEKECLAVIMSIEHYLPWVQGSKFEVVTDCSSLTWIMKLKEPKGRLARWVLRLQAHDFTIKYRPGVQNVLADAFSRAVEVDVVDVNEKVNKEDSQYTKMKNNIIETPEKFKNFKVEQNYIYKYTPLADNLLGDVAFSWKLYVPQHLQSEILKQSHDEAGHFGHFKTLQKIKLRYFWPKMSSCVRDYVQKCETCRVSKDTTPKNKPLMGAQKSVSRPFQAYSLDFMGEFPKSKKGNCHLLVVTDLFSKFVFVHPVRQANSRAIVNFVESQVFLSYGIPQYVICDNAQAFKSKMFVEFLNHYKIQLRSTAVYSPQSNPTERVNRVIKNSLRCYIGEQEHRVWEDYIYKIAFSINTSVHVSTGYTPYFVVFGREAAVDGTDNASRPQPSFDTVNNETLLAKVREKVQANLKTAFDRYSHYYNLRARPLRQYKEGDVVYKDNFKLSNAGAGYSSKLGPKKQKCIVSKVTGSNTYQLKSSDGKDLGVFHAKNL